MQADQPALWRRSSCPLRLISNICSRNKTAEHNESETSRLIQQLAMIWEAGCC